MLGCNCIRRARLGIKGPAWLPETLQQQQASITASAINGSGQCRADLGSRAVEHSPNVHEAAQEMDAFSGFRDLPIGAPGAPTQPQSPLHPGLSLPATHGDHNDVPVTRLDQQDTTGSIPHDSEAIYYSLLLCAHIHGKPCHAPPEHVICKGGCAQKHLLYCCTPLLFAYPKINVCYIAAHRCSLHTLRSMSAAYLLGV